MREAKGKGTLKIEKMLPKKSKSDPLKAARVAGA